MKKVKTALFLIFLLFSNNAYSEEKIYDLGELDQYKGDKQIDISNASQRFILSFKAKLYGGTVFVVIDLPEEYSLDTQVPFRKKGIENGLMRHRYCFLNRDYLASKKFSFYIIKKQESKNPILRAGLYPLVEGTCE